MTDKVSSNVAVTACALVKLKTVRIPKSERGFGFTLRQLPAGSLTSTLETDVRRPSEYSGGLLAFDVAAVKSGSNAELSGLRTGDRIISVNGLLTSDRTVEEVVEQMKSCQGSIQLVVAAPERSSEERVEHSATLEREALVTTRKESQVPGQPEVLPALGDASQAGLPVNNVDALSADGIPTDTSNDDHSLNAQVMRVNLPDSSLQLVTSSDLGTGSGQAPSPNGAPSTTVVPSPDEHLDWRASSVPSATAEVMPGSSSTPLAVNFREAIQGTGRSSLHPSARSFLEGGSPLCVSRLHFDWPARASKSTHAAKPVASCSAAGLPLTECDLVATVPGASSLPATYISAHSPGLLSSPRQVVTGIVRERAAALCSTSPPPLLFHGKVQSPPLTTLLEVSQVLSPDIETSGTADLGYQQSAPRLPQRILRAPVAVDDGGLSPNGADDATKRVPPAFPPTQTAAEADVTANAIAPLSVRYLPAYSQTAKPVDSLYPRATWQRKYGVASSSIQHLRQPSDYMSHQHHVASAKVSPPPVRGRSSTLSRLHSSSVAVQSGHPGGPLPRAAVTRQVSGRRGESFRSAAGSGHSMGSSVILQGSKVAEVLPGDQAWQAQPTASLALQPSYKSAPNIRMGPMSVTDEQNSPSLPDASDGDSVASELGAASSDIVRRQRLGSEADACSHPSHDSEPCWGSARSASRDDSARLAEAQSLLPRSTSSASLGSLRAVASRRSVDEGGDGGSPGSPSLQCRSASGIMLAHRSSSSTVNKDLGIVTQRRGQQPSADSAVPGLRLSRSFGSAVNDSVGGMQQGCVWQSSEQEQGQSSELPGFDNVSLNSAVTSSYSPLEGTFALPSLDLGQASASSSAGSGSGEDSRSVESLQSTEDSLDSVAPLPSDVPPVSVRNDSNGSESGVVLRTKSADSAELRAQLARRTSYMLATSTTAGPTGQAQSAQPAVSSADSVGNEAAPSSSNTPKAHLRKFKLFSDKTHTIKDGHEKEQATGEVGGFIEPLPSPGLLPRSKEGSLMVKMEKTDGRRSVDRSWRPLGVALAGHTLYFSRDKKEHSSSSLSAQSLSSLASEEMSVNVYKCKINLAQGHTKKKNTFHVETLSNSELLLQASSSEHMMAWIRAILMASKDPDEPGKEAAVEAAIRLIEQQRANVSEHAAVAAAAAAAAARHNAGRKLPFWNRGHAATTPEHGQPPMAKKNRKVTPNAAATARIPDDETAGSATDGLCAFGVPLSECSPSHENEFVPLVVEQCTKFIEERGLEFTGLYRVPGKAAAVTALQKELNRGVIDLENERWRDVNVVGSLLKLFFRKLPEPLVTLELYPAFINANRTSLPEDRLRTLKHLVHSLPECNFETLRYLTRHLRKVADFGHVNKMDSRNLAIVFGPTLIGSADETMLAMVTDMSDQCRIIESVITHSEWIFTTPTADDTVPILSENEVESVAPISETIHSMGDDIARIASGGDSGKALTSIASAANRKVKEEKIKPNLASSLLMEPGFRGYSERNIDAEVAARQVKQSLEAEDAVASKVPASPGASADIREAINYPAGPAAQGNHEQGTTTPKPGAALTVPAAWCQKPSVETLGETPAVARRKPPPSLSNSSLAAGKDTGVISCSHDNEAASSVPPPVPARRHAVISDSFQKDSTPGSVCDSASDLDPKSSTAESAKPRPPRPPRLSLNAAAVTCDERSISDGTSDADAAKLTVRSYCNIYIPPVGLSAGTTLVPPEIDAPTSPVSVTNDNGTNSPALKEGSSGPSEVSNVNTQPRVTFGLSAETELDDGGDLMLAVTSKFDQKLKYLVSSRNHGVQEEGDEGLDLLLSIKTPATMSPNVCAAAGASSADNFRDPTLHKRLPQSEKLAARRSTGMDNVIAGNIDAVIPSASMPENLTSFLGDVTSKEAGENTAHHGGTSARHVDDSDDASVSKRKMSDERKRLRRRHTLGGADHFEHFKEVGSSAGQPISAQIQVPRAACYFVHPPLLSHRDFASSSARGWTGSPAIMAYEPVAISKFSTP